MESGQHGSAMATGSSTKKKKQNKENIASILKNTIYCQYYYACYRSVHQTKKSKWRLNIIIIKSI